MRIDNTHIKAFGRLKNIDLHFDHQLNVLYGLNESGKSTLFHALSTLMMGFSPAKADLNPYMPWDNVPIEIEGQLMHQNKQFNVQRTLKNTPSGVLFTGESREKLVNQALPEMKFITREVFNSLFALRIDNLNGEVLKTKSWQEIKEYYMFELAKDRIVSPSKVLNRLENEKNSLLRKDNRGNQYIRELESNIKDLKGQVKLASADFDAYALKQQSLNHLHHEHGTVKDQLAALKVHQKQLELLLPYKELENKFNLISSNFPSHIDIAMVKTALALEDQLMRSTQLYDQMKEQNQREKLQCETLKSSLIPLTEKEHALYNARNELSTLTQHRLAYEDRERLLFTVDQELKNHTNQLNMIFLEAFHLSYSSQYDDAINGLDLAKASSVLREIKDLKQYQAIDGSFKKSPQWLLLLGAATLCLIAVGLLVALPLTPLRLFLIVFNLGFSVALGIGFWKQKGQYENLHRTTEQQKTKQLRLKALYDELGKSLVAIIPDNEQVMHLDESFIQNFIRVKGTLQTKQSTIAQRDELVSLQNTIKDQLDGFEVKFDITIQTASRQLRGIEEKHNQWQVDYEKWRYVLNQYETSQTMLLEYKAGMARLSAEILSIMKCDLSDWENQKHVIKESVLRYEQLSAEIEAFSHLKTLQTDNDFESYEAMLLEKLKADAQVDELQQRELRLYGDIRALEKDCDHLREKDMYHDKLSELTGTEVKLEEAREKHLKLSILVELIHYADDQFKVLYQPEYLQKASQYLSMITCGKYVEIIIDENDTVLLILKDQAIPIETLNTLSSGTLNQLYFSLFLSLIDVIDPQKVFPLFLDDVFLTWDDYRFESALHLISDVSKTRQIFMLSCSSEYTTRCSQVLNIKPMQMI